MVLVNLLPLIVCAAVMPLWIIVSLLLVRGKNGVTKAAAFVSGAMIVRIGQGILFGYFFASASRTSGGTSDHAIASTLLVLLGLTMLIAAFRTWYKEDDPDAPPPRWMAALSEVSALQAFGVGALLMLVAMKQWVFTLAAIAVIEEARLSHKVNVLVYLAFVLIAKSLVLAPVIAAAVWPTRSAPLLDATQGWLERNNRAIAIAASVIFGSWFLWRGIAGLIGWRH